MRAAKHILNVMLVFTILISGLPVFNAEDANRDRRVDLQDVILRVRDLARTADAPDTFKSNIKKTLSTLYAVSGLKKLIKQPGDTKSITILAGVDLPYIISSNILLPLSHNSAKLQESFFFYESVSITPASPPPQGAIA